jgi:hypothetical protein
VGQARKNVGGKERALESPVTEVFRAGRPGPHAWEEGGISATSGIILCRTSRGDRTTRRRDAPQVCEIEGTLKDE